jgi:parallel beta-helix repeat protein
VLQNGHARIVSNTVQLNPNGGILVQENSFARIGFLDLGGPALPNTIRNNRVAGIVVDSASGAWVVGNIISENGGAGVIVKGASQATLSGNRIDRNDTDGVSVLRNSSVQLGGEAGILDAPNDTGQVNGGAGLACSLNSSAAGRRGTLDGARGAGIFDTSCTNGLDDLR